MAVGWGSYPAPHAKNVSTNKIKCVCKIDGEHTIFRLLAILLAHPANGMHNAFGAVFGCCSELQWPKNHCLLAAEDTLFIAQLLMTRRRVFLTAIGLTLAFFFCSEKVMFI